MKGIIPIICETRHYYFELLGHYFSLSNMVEFISYFVPLNLSNFKMITMRLTSDLLPNSILKSYFMMYFCCWSILCICIYTTQFSVGIFSYAAFFSSLNGWAVFDMVKIMQQTIQPVEGD